MIVETSTLLAGIGIGVAVAAPVGPTSLLCMRRTLARGPLAGIETGLGIALGDSIYAALATLGVASVSRIIVDYERPMHAIAGTFLLYIGLDAVLRHPRSDDARQRPTLPAVSAFASAFVLTMTNPSTTLSYVAIFTVVATRTSGQANVMLALVSGVFFGSMLWWVALVTVVASFRRTFGPRTRTIVDAVASSAFVAFGLIEVGRSLR